MVKSIIILKLQTAKTSSRTTRHIPTKQQQRAPNKRTRKRLQERLAVCCVLRSPVETLTLPIASIAIYAQKRNTASRLGPLIN